MADDAPALPAPVKIYYWGVMGRAGSILRMLAEADIAYEHISDGAAVAAQCALMGAQTDTFAPPIVNDGETVVSQSVAAAFYIGEKAGFPAPDPFRALQLVHNVVDLAEGLSQAVGKTAADFKTFLQGAEGKPGRFQLMAAALERAVKGPFFFGEDKTWVDFYFGHNFALLNYCYLDSASKVSGSDVWAAYPKLKAIAAAILGLESAAKITAPLMAPSYHKAETEAIFSELAPK